MADERNATRASVSLVVLALLWSARRLLALPVCVLLLGTVTFYLEGYQANQQLVTHDLWGSLYLAAITALTIGYGDLSPAGPLGRIAAVSLGVAGVLVLGVVVSAVTKALERIDVPATEARAASDRR